ncbi:MAG: DNA repair protein RecO [Parcubacteria group bacterium]|jgi:DNA repair protein RecO (recombination protein O)|nr:DNA repair protein RecO [Parcubacteria group bacterium]|tara:strand:- start:4836 stop:5375 length:540 start_codon:yes stop_codon:yes gene_type:complete
MLLKTQGIIIKKANLGEADRLLTIYTEDFGKILVKAKSVRKNQAKLKGHLELFLHNHLMIAPGRGLDIITGAETIEGFSYLHQDLSSLAASYYLSELIDKLISDSEKDINIWPLLLNSLQEFNRPNQPIKTIINNFENRLLEFLGYGCEQKDPVCFIESFLKEELNSKYFLQRVNHLVK